METQFTDVARKVLALAEQEARGLGHEYVGTEHLLLGILGEGGGLVLGAMATCGVDAANVRAGIERLVHRGPSDVGLKTLPKTPRAKKAIEYAEDESRSLAQKWIGPEHLLLGLICEEDGVAGRVLRELGISAKRIGQEVFKIRVAQLKAVEKVVRPIPAPTLLKQTMRNELLSHLEAIYEQEQARLGDPAAALAEAKRRFGDAAELTRELQSSVGLAQRCAYRMERWFGWRAPETAAHWMLRAAIGTFCTFGLCVALALVIASQRYGWTVGLLIALRPLLIAWIVVPANTFLIGVLYFTMRDALCGAPWARRSIARVVGMDLLIGLVMLGSILAFAAGQNWESSQWFGFACRGSLIGLALALGCLFYASKSGPIEIRHAVWELIDLRGEA